MLSRQATPRAAIAGHRCRRFEQTLRQCSPCSRGGWMRTPGQWRFVINAGLSRFRRARFEGRASLLPASGFPRCRGGRHSTFGTEMINRQIGSGVRGAARDCPHATGQTTPPGSCRAPRTDVHCDGVLCPAALSPSAPPRPLPCLPNGIAFSRGRFSSQRGSAQRDRSLGAQRSRLGATTRRFEARQLQRAVRQRPRRVPSTHENSSPPVRVDPFAMTP